MSKIADSNRYRKKSRIHTPKVIQCDIWKYMISEKNYTIMPIQMPDWVIAWIIRENLKL